MTRSMPVSNNGMSGRRSPGLPSAVGALKRRLSVSLITIACLALGLNAATATFKSVLQGQNAGNTNWVNGPLVGWAELDTIPIRTLHTGGPATNQVITVNFDHSKSFATIPG